MINLRYAHIYTVGLVGSWLAIFMDGNFISEYIRYNQWLASALMLLIFLWVYGQVSQSIKLIMQYGLVLAAVGESFLSLVLGMYTYRLENIPLYVPTGHMIAFACTCYILKEPLIQKYLDIIMRILYLLLVVFATVWLFYQHDLLGFLFMLVTVWILYRYPINKPMFLITFFVGTSLELVGTFNHCWEYPSIWFGQFEWIPSGSPPSAICLVYSLFDLGCLWLYKRFNRRAWNRMRAIQQIGIK